MIVDIRIQLEKYSMIIIFIKPSLEPFMHYFLFLVHLILISAQLESINQIINGKFAHPGLPSGAVFKYYPKSIEGWSCKKYCQIQNCSLTSYSYPKVNKTSLDCSGYVIETNSQNSNEEITQTLNLSVNRYWLSIDYFYPSKKANQRQLQIIFNQQILFSVVPNVTFSIDIFKFQKQIVAKDGKNTLTIKMVGLNDGVGFKIGNVSLHREINSLLQNTLDNLFKLQALHSSNSVPGARIFFFSFLGFMVNFDRLELYLYHNRQYSKNSQTLFQKINQLSQAKGNLIQVQIKEYFPSFVKVLDRIFTSCQIKKRYISYNVEDENQSHYSLLSNIHHSLNFSVPIAITLFFLFHITFKLLQRWPISVIFRPYAFYTTLIFVLLQGNIESLTFYSFKELQTFFSFNFQHKLLNLISIITLFFIMFFCFGLCLFLKYHYQRKAKLMMNTEKSTLPSIISTSFDRGMIIFILGATHQLLLQYPNLQMFALIAIELLWILEKIIMRASFIHSLFFLISLLESLLRICLQITCLIYSHYQEMRLEINSQYHFYLIFGFLGVIALNFLINAIFMLKHFIVRHIFRKNTVRNALDKRLRVNDRKFNVIFKSDISFPNKQCFQRKAKRILKKQQKNVLNNILPTMMIPDENTNTVKKRQIKKRLKFQVVFGNQKYESKFTVLKKQYD